MFSFKSDPLQEEKYTVMPGLVHKYENRILVELNFTCPVVCQFCTRKRKGISKNKFKLTYKKWLEIEKYILKNPKIREIILSGGEPLMDINFLIKILERIKDLSQIKIIRIHTRIPITYPDMVSMKLLKFFTKETKLQPIYMSIHCDHKNELTERSKEVIESLRKTGVILYSQSVLLKN